MLMDIFHLIWLSPGKDVNVKAALVLAGLPSQLPE